MSLLEIRDLHAGYGEIEVLLGVSLAVEEGRIVTLIGANGAGKTTLLKTISGLIRSGAGDIEFDGRMIARRPAHWIVKAGISQVAEGRAILKRMTVMDNLRMGAYSRNDRGIAADIGRMLEKFPVLAERSGQLAGTLSGGEQQMLAIGRALMARPSATWLMPALTVQWAGRRAIIAPSNAISPAVGRIRPEMVLSRVVLPAPLAPIRVTMRPSSTVRLTPCRTSISP